MTDNKKQNYNYNTDNLWCDTETTGLDVYQTLDNGERVHGALYYSLINVALILPKVNENGIIILDDAPAFNVGIKLTDQAMMRMNPWAKALHEKSGLLERLNTGEGFDYLASGNEDAETAIIEWLNANGVSKFNREEGNGAMLFGNNISFDLAFINAQMPNLYKYFHYRKGDVSAINVLSRTAMWRHLGITGIEKSLEHTALNDIAESAQELNHYTMQLNESLSYKVKYQNLLTKFPDLEID